MEKQLNIALVAHDRRKADMIECELVAAAEQAQPQPRKFLILKGDFRLRRFQSLYTPQSVFRLSLCK